MATEKFKAALNAAAFPFSYITASRAVVNPGNDSAPRTNQAFYGSKENQDFNLMQLLYCENVLPIARGLQTVAYSEEYAAYTLPATDFDQLILIRDSQNNNASFSPARGKNYVYSDLTNAWVSYSPFVWSAVLTLVTRAYVNGRTLIFYEATKCIEWVPSIPNMVTRVLVLPVGYTVADIRGNSAASNYHLLFTEVEILWSTLTDVLDFATVASGAGRQIPNDIRGKITSVLPIAGGFIIYTTENAVAATFTNDASRPFAYREVQNSAGVSSLEQVTGDANAVGHYTYGSAGIQLVTLQGATTVLPDCADFLVSRVLESWDTATKRAVQTALNQNLQPKLQYLGSRYLIISYGSSSQEFSFALVYDTVLLRWGKLQIEHVDCGALPLEALGSSYRYFTLEEAYSFYDLPYADLEQTLGTVVGLRQNYGFLAKDGSVQLLSMVDGAATASGVAVFGPIQLVRSREITVQKVELDGLVTVPAPIITLLGSSTGYARTSNFTMTPVAVQDNYAEYHSRFTEKNVQLAVEGNFQLTNLIVEATVHGKR